MICLDKLQRELAYFLEVDLRDLPKVEDILKAQGYTGIDKAGDIVYFDEPNKITKAPKQAVQQASQLKQEPIKDFGQNYAEFYHKPQEAINHLLETKSGQVQGAFYKEGLGDIDLVWGDSKMGLAHILEKHKEDFKAFGNDKEGVINGLSEIVENGKVVTENGVSTIIYKYSDNTYRVGISKGFHNTGDNNWVITAYKVDRSPRPDSLPSGEVNKSDGTNLHSSDLEANHTATSQTSLFDSANTQAKQGLESSLAHKPKDTKAAKNSFNESSPNIMHSNAHIGSGLLSGSVAGIEQDEQGNISFNPQKFALGFLGGAVGSKAVSSGFQYMKANPQLKQAIIKELANTLAQGFEAAKAKYPLLQTLEPRYIVQNERGRLTQAKSMLKEAEGKAAYQQREQTKELLSALVGKDIVNQNDGRVAQISRKNIAKMTSDKAISKSVDNGFSELEHFAAVQDIQRLYQNAVLKETHKDIKGGSHNVLIHRYNAKLDNDTNALITLKETLSGKYEGSKIYTLELEALELKPTLPEPQGSETMSRNTIRKAIVTPTESLDESITEKSLIDVSKMDKQRQGEYFNNSFSVSKILSDDFLKKYKIAESSYIGSVQIGAKLKGDEYHIMSNTLYISKEAFNKNKISNEAMDDYLTLNLPQYTKEKTQEFINDLYARQDKAYREKIPLSRVKAFLKAESQNEEIPLLKEAKEKFKDFSPQKVKDLLEWHKDSSPITKDEKGLPKVFYHGSTSGKKINIFDNNFDKSGWGFWFSPLRAVSNSFAKNNKPQAVFLKLKKPFDMSKGVDFDLLKREDLFFSEGQIKELKGQFKRVKTIYHNLLDDLETQGIKPLEFFSGGSFWGTKNGKVFYFGNDNQHHQFLSKKATKFKESKNYKDFREWQQKYEVKGGVRNEYDLLFKMTKQGDYINNHVQSDLILRGYDGIKVSENEFTIFDSSQAKALENKGAYRDSYNDLYDKPSKREIKENELTHRYFNESSPNIMHSNAHIGSGLLSGSVAGIEQDEQGNISFNPQKFALGFLGGAVGSKAVSSGFQYMKANPQLKQAIIKELANTLAQGFEAAKAKYPLLQTLEPRYIVQNERGRLTQAKSMLKEAEGKLLEQEREAISNVLNGSAYKAEILKDLQSADEILATLTKGYHRGKTKGFSVKETKEMIKNRQKKTKGF